MKDKKPNVGDGHKKRFFHLSRRMLLVVFALFAVFAVFAVWLGFKVSRAHWQREAVAWVKANGGSAQYGWQYDERLVRKYDPIAPPAPPAASPAFLASVPAVNLTTARVIALARMRPM